MSRIALMQPAFLPWQGYFALVAAVDIFVFLDDFQVSRRSFSQRNRLLVGPGNVDWLTVPLERGDGLSFNEVRVQNGGKWRDKTLCCLQRSYGRFPFGRAVMPLVEEWLCAGEIGTLGDLDEGFVRIVSRELGLTPVFRRSSDFPSPLRRSLRLADLLRRNGAERYCSAFGSYPYMRDDGVFPLPDVETVFLDYDPLPYPRAGAAGFTPRLSMLDALFAVGVEECRRLIEDGTRWLSWEERGGKEDRAEETDACLVMD